MIDVKSRNQRVRLACLRWRCRVGSKNVRGDEATVLSEGCRTMKEKLESSFHIMKARRVNQTRLSFRKCAAL